MPDAPRDEGTVASRGAGHGAPAAVPAPDGRVIAGYVLEEVAGAGGMGVVYRATDTELGRTVALKLIAPERAEDPALRELFVRESLTAAGLEHPNVIPIHRAGEDGGSLYIAMRFVEGASLQELIEASPGGLPPGRAARIVARVADALDAAHARGLVHRDVKPANVLIADPDGDEHIYLTDFGLTVPTARQARAEGGWAGTLAYLAPEQIDGGALGARTDVYALGCVLFHALTGRAPFTGSEEEVLEAHRSEAPPAPSSLVPGLPPAMDAVVQRAMAKAAEDRFASAGELGRAALAARYDVALLADDGDRPAAEGIATSLAESGLVAHVAAGDRTRTAEGVRASGAAVVVVGRSGLGAWAREGLAAARDLAARDRAFRQVLVLLPGAPDPADPQLAYLATHPWVDMRGGLDDALAAGDLLRALRGADVAPGLPVAGGECPYRGLEAFREEDAPLFFGREQDVAQLVERLRTQRFIAVLGPSGSGKSSLVRAGLLPAVRHGAVAGGDGWRVAEVVPGEHPLAALAAALAQVPGAGAPSAPDLAASERALDQAAASALDGRPEGERLLVLVDQLEEAFTLCTDPGERAAFLGNLVYAATIPGGRVVVVATMRADFYHRLAEHPEMRALAATHQHLVGPMDARALRRAIEEPARAAGLDLEPGLTRRILTDVSDRPGTLPLLEHLLVELWTRRRDRTLTLEAYAASGGVEGALARRANEVYSAMPPERQALARRVLLRLTQPGEGTEDTRRRALRSELVTRPDEQGEVDAVVDALVGARLVTAGRDPASGEPAVEVTHEALIRGWPELRGWLDEDRDRLRAERRLSDAAAEWERGGREDGALYRGARLAAWQERDRSSLNPRENAFLAASDALAERERATRRRRTRIALGALSAVAVVVAVLAIFAFVQRGNASEQRDLALSRQIAASSQSRLKADPEESLLLARKAYSIAPTSQAEEALRVATSQSHVRFAYRGHRGVVRGVAVTRDGGTAASAGDDGSIQLWSPSRPDAGHRTLTGHRGPVQAVAFSRDERVLVSGGRDGTVRTWTVSTGKPLERFTAGSRPVRGVAISADGAVVAAGGADGFVRVWRDGDPQPVVMQGRLRSVTGVALSRDGATIAASGGDGSTGLGFSRVWESASGRILRSDGPNAPYTGLVTAIAFSPDGADVYTASYDNTVSRIPVAGGRPAKVIDTLGTALTSVSIEGNRIATGAIDGSAAVWDLDGGRIVDLRGHRGSVTAIAFVPHSPMVITAGEDGQVLGWDWRSADPPHLAADDIGTARVTSSPASVEYVTYSGGVGRWNSGNGVRTPAVEPPVAANWFALNGRGDIARENPGGVITIARGDGTRMPDIRGVPADTYELALSENGRWLAVSDTRGDLLEWDLSGRTAGQILAARADANADLAVSESGAVAARIGRRVTLWEEPGGSARTFTAADQPVRALAFTPDGRFLATGADDGTVRVWPVGGGESVALLRHGAGVRGLEFSPDGRLLAAAASDQAVVWDWRRGIADVRWPDPGVNEVHFDSAGERILTVAQVGLRLWTCDVCGPVQKVLETADGRVTRTLTDAERREFAPGS